MLVSFIGAKILANSRRRLLLIICVEISFHFTVGARITRSLLTDEYDKTINNEHAKIASSNKSDVSSKGYF